MPYERLVCSTKEYINPPRSEGTTRESKSPFVPMERGNEHLFLTATDQLSRWDKTFYDLISNINLQWLAVDMQENLKNKFSIVNDQTQ
ncbi:hypothetical protein LV85_01006 [Algoriphagus chordae]|uniref:Uncharacterized protein n=2 Tax=Algoriphagus chordae TaxID=237019 RepID=A0A2W7R6L4_9BACT|nr:hypothetical protein LV85_01006 [Algoriphagus chordae]